MASPRRELIAVGILDAPVAHTVDAVGERKGHLRAGRGDAREIVVDARHLDVGLRAQWQAFDLERDLDGIAAQARAVGRLTPLPRELETHHARVEVDATLQILHLEDGADGIELRIGHVARSRKKGPAFPAPLLSLILMSSTTGLYPPLLRK